jgi:hypothetical protein
MHQRVTALIRLVDRFGLVIGETESRDHGCAHHRDDLWLVIRP